MTMIKLGLGPWKNGAHHSPLLTDVRMGPTVPITSPGQGLRAPSPHRGWYGFFRRAAKRIQSRSESARRPARS
ncbi:MAG: hypothetical protein AB3N23_20170 [Paracoccaceae bacterium]